MATVLWIEKLRPQARKEVSQLRQLEMYLPQALSNGPGGVLARKKSLSYDTPLQISESPVIE